MSAPNSSNASPLPTAVLVAKRARPSAKVRRKLSLFGDQIPWMRIAIGGTLGFQGLILVLAIYFSSRNEIVPIADGDLLDAPVQQPAPKPILVAKVPEPLLEVDVKIFPEEKAEFVECARIGSDVRFMAEPADAFKRARDQKKLLFMVHLSGNFEDKEFT